MPKCRKLWKRCRPRTTRLYRRLWKKVAKQGQASTAAVIAGMHTTGDGTAFKDLVKLEKTYTDPDMLRQFCLWENSAVDHMEAMGKKVLQARRRALSKKNPNYAPGMSDTGGDHPEYLKWIDATEQKRVKDLYHDVMVVPPHPGALRDQSLARVCRDPEGDNKDLDELKDADRQD